ncbi:hypothetical protein HMSSN139_32850 [Paenibacillus sp. HMSSN-139]|nr:hypothetical protein HMSSN139_32850 [Paenibacillus sp. HMSSN-139]
MDMSSKKTMYEKIWDNHVIYQEEGKPSILYIDLHLVHEVTSPQALKDSASAAARYAVRN